jgi:diguanylate cyclase (GGDEF)-like protein
VTLSERIGAKVIVAGIETEAELRSLVSMGVHLGQGFFIAEPSCPKPAIRELIPAKRSRGQSNSHEWKCSTPVGVLVQPAMHVTPDTTVAEAKRMLADAPPMGSVVVVESRKPVGLLMSYNLDRHLGTPYGIPLFFHREVARLMDRNPLIVDSGMPVEKAAKAAMKREARKVYDDIIVTEEGLFFGTISVQKMLDTLAKVQVEMAKGANPLTGLPGNVAIEQEISRRAAGGIASSLIYIDLDNFKAYNDAYGFENGDKMISFTSTALSEAVGKEGMPGDFIGHVGGDDFVVVSGQDRAEPISRAIVAIFEKSIAGLYSETDRKRGYIRGRGRDGAERQYPLVSVSIGIVDCEFECSFTMNELSLRVAEIKKYAKMKPGNTYVRDRRAALGSKSVEGEGREEIAECELRIAE